MAEPIPADGRSSPMCRDIKLMLPDEGPVTDYGATVVHWMRRRQPRWKGSYSGETERPSNSYIVDVSLILPVFQPRLTSIADAASPRQGDQPG
jgi:polyadenylation factor subunit 2